MKIDETGRVQYHRFTTWQRIKQFIWVRWWMFRYGRR